MINKLIIIISNNKKNKNKNNNKILINRKIIYWSRTIFSIIAPVEGIANYKKVKEALES